MDEYTVSPYSGNKFAKVIIFSAFVLMFIFIVYKIENKTTKILLSAVLSICILVSLLKTTGTSENFEDGECDDDSECEDQE